jgi:REP element-mobilizing transposase RayT
MATPRSHLIAPGSSGYYHCVQRCVRRAFLCGEDRQTGHSFEHRKGWIEQRLHLLAECFAIAVHAYAVMSNHVHVVMEVTPDIVEAWTDEEVATRWLRVFPPSSDDPGAAALKREQLLADTSRLCVIRARLCDLSWFMRCLAEPVARRANREDGCKGRFWEGRFKSQLLCDERSLLAAMAYVDLNPIRAGLAEGLESSAHTGASERIARARSTPTLLQESLQPIAGASPNVLSINSADYLQLLDWTGRGLVAGKRGKIDADAPAILSMIDRPDRWVLRVAGYGSEWARVVGTVHDLVDKADQIGQRWLKGLRLARQLG